MPEQKREARLGTGVPGIHVLLSHPRRGWPGRRPAMTEQVVRSLVSRGALDVAGITMLADLSGALVWEEQRLLVVSDLHLEKGSSFALRGVLLPPYDTVATLGRLAAVVARHDPRMVIALGDSFHDRDAHARLSDADRDTLTALQAGRPWISIPCKPPPPRPNPSGAM